MLSYWVDLIKAGGAGPLSFVSLCILVLGWLVSRLFSSKDNIRARVFVFTILSLGLGLLVIRLTPAAGTSDPVAPTASSSNAGAEVVAASASASASTPAQTAAPIEKQAVITQPVRVTVPRVERPPQQLSIDELTRLADRYYDLGKFADAYRLNTEGCSRGVGISCYWNGYLAENGKGMPADLSKASDWYDKGCRMGEGNSCARRDTLQ